MRKLFDIYELKDGIRKTGLLIGNSSPRSDGPELSENQTKDNESAPGQIVLRSEQPSFMVLRILSATSVRDGGINLPEQNIRLFRRTQLYG